MTEVGALERFTTTPAWYSALPSDLRAYFDGNNVKAQSLVNDVLGKTTGSVTGGATGTAAGTRSTGVATPEKVVQYMGAGVAAAMAGVFAL